jgi:hypothetical protein
LLAKCRVLQEENDEFGRQLSEGTLSTHKIELNLLKELVAELKRNLSESNEFVLQLDSEVEMMQSRIFELQQQLIQLKKWKELYMEQQKDLERLQQQLQERSDTLQILTREETNDGRTEVEREGESEEEEEEEEEMEREREEREGTSHSDIVTVEEQKQEQEEKGEEEEKMSPPSEYIHEHDQRHELSCEHINKEEEEEEEEEEEDNDTSFQQRDDINSSVFNEEANIEPQQ